MAELLLEANGRPFVFRCKGCGDWMCSRTCRSCRRKHYIHELREITGYRITTNQKGSTA